jgi:hypothetical protein
MANWSRRNLSSPDPQKYMAEFWSAGVHSSKLQKTFKIILQKYVQGGIFIPVSWSFWVLQLESTAAINFSTAL